MSREEDFFRDGVEQAARVVEAWGEFYDEQTFNDPEQLAAEIRALTFDGSDFCSPEFPCGSTQTGVSIGERGDAVMWTPYICNRHRRIKELGR